MMGETQEVENNSIHILTSFSTHYVCYETLKRTNIYQASCCGLKLIVDLA